MNFKLLIPAVLVIIGAYNFNVQKIYAQELDPNILWVADSAIGRIDGFAVHPNGNLFIHRKGVVSEINGTDGKKIKELTKVGKFGEIESIDISSDGNLLVTGYDDVVIHNLTDFSTKIVARGSRVVFLPNQQKIAYRSMGYIETKGSDSSIVILDLETNLRRHIKTTDLMESFAFSPDGRFLATGGVLREGGGKVSVTLRLWDANTLLHIKELKNIADNNSDTHKIQFSDDSKKVGFQVGWDNLYIFNTETFSLEKLYNEETINLSIRDFTFISNEYIGIQSEKTSIIRLSDDHIKNLFDFGVRGFIGINKTKEVLFSGTGYPKQFGPIRAWDLNKVFSSVENETESTQIQASYQKGTLTLSGIHSVSNNVNIEIFDINGKLVHKIDSQHISSEMRVPLKLANGTYLIQIIDGSQTHSGKFLVVE